MVLEKLLKFGREIMLDYEFKGVYGAIDNNKTFAPRRLERAVLRATKNGYSREEILPKVIEGSKRYEALGRTRAKNDNFDAVEVLENYLQKIPKEYREEQEVLEPFESLALSIYKPEFDEMKISARILMNAILNKDTNPENIYNSRILLREQVLDKIARENIIDCDEYKQLKGQISRVLEASSKETSLKIGAFEEAQEVGHRGAAYIPEWDDKKH